MNNSYSIQQGEKPVRTGLQSFFAYVYQNVALGLLLCGGVSFFIVNSPALLSVIFGTPLFYVVLFAPFILSLYISYNIRNITVERAQLLYWVYVGAIGVSISAVLLAYTSTSIASSFLTAGVVFGAASFYGRTTTGDLSKMNNILLMGLFGIIFASLINIFMQSSVFATMISLLSVAVFTALIAYENQSLQSIYYMRSSEEELHKLAILGSLNLFIAFINIFLALLQLTGSRRE